MFQDDLYSLCHRHVQYQASKLLYLSLCWNDDQDKEPMNMIDTKIIYCKSHLILAIMRSSLRLPSKSVYRLLLSLSST